MSENPDELRKALQSWNRPGRAAGYLGPIDDETARSAAEIMGCEMFRVEKVEIVPPGMALRA